MTDQVNIEQFIHAEELLPGGGSVILLNTRSELTAEDEAMLQALHSRSASGIRGHLRRLAKVGSGNFMKNFYVGYGHKSIGDCGSITLFVEGISMLAAKAIQDWPLYSGQEASTRYIDFGSQPFMDPLNSEKTRAIQERWRDLYVRNLPLVEEHVASQYPKHADEDEGVYRKAVKARAFDIMRSVLPAGATTNIAWHSNLRQLRDKLDWLRPHPLEEVRNIAKALEKVLITAYPNSFSNKRYMLSDDFRLGVMAYHYLHTPEEGSVPNLPQIMHDGIDYSKLSQDCWREVMEARPPKTELPSQIGECGSLRFEFLLDYGSFRDLQRQRSVIQRMPLLSTTYGFLLWYENAMPPEVREEVLTVLGAFEQAYDDLNKASDGTSVNYLQYYVPMGYQVPVSMTGHLGSMVYIAELRSRNDVHPTLRAKALFMSAALEHRYGGYGLKLHIDQTELDRFTTVRGTADIVERA